MLLERYFNDTYNTTIQLHRIRKNRYSVIVIDTDSKLPVDNIAIFEQVQPARNYINTCMKN